MKYFRSKAFRRRTEKCRPADLLRGQRRLRGQRGGRHRAARREGALAGPLGGPAGEDSNGDRVLAALAREGVDCAGCQRIAGLATALSAIFIDARGDRMIVTYRDDRIATAVPADPKPIVAGADAVLADNRFPDFVRPICGGARARHHGRARRRPADRDVRGPVPDRHARGVLRRMPARHDRCRRSRRRAAARRRHNASLSRRHQRTRGRALARWANLAQEPGLPDQGGRHACRRRRRLHGGFTLALAEGRDVVAAMRFAAAAAGLKCTRLGGSAARRGAPRWKRCWRRARPRRPGLNQSASPPTLDWPVQAKTRQIMNAHAAASAGELWDIRSSRPVELICFALAWRPSSISRRHWCWASGCSTAKAVSFRPISSTSGPPAVSCWRDARGCLRPGDPPGGRICQHRLRVRRLLRMALSAAVPVRRRACRDAAVGRGASALVAADVPRLRGRCPHDRRPAHRHSARLRVSRGALEPRGRSERFLSAALLGGALGLMERHPCWPAACWAC